MTQSTNVVNAIDAAIWLDNATGTLKDISGVGNSITITMNQTIGVQRNFQTRWPRRLDGVKDGSFAMNISYSKTTDEALQILRDWLLLTDPGSRSIKVYIPDKNVGSDMYSAEVKIQDINIPLVNDQADPITVTVNLLPDGAISVSTATT